MLFLSLFCALQSIGISQQDKQFTHYTFDRMSYNPATTGFNGYSGTIIYRNQWDRVQDAPNTTLINFQGNMQNLKVGPGSFGVGVSYLNDAIGFVANNNMTANLAYHFPTVYGKLSAGVGAGFVNIGFDPDWIPPETPVGQDLVINDIATKISAFGTDFNLGLFWEGKENYFVGLSMTHVIPDTIKKVNFSMARHYYVQGGYEYETGIKDFNRQHPIYIKPGFLIKADGATAIFDLNIMADVWLNQNSYVWGGLTYRYSDAVALMVGFGNNLNGNLKVGYSFDIMTNLLGSHGRGSHELMINYAIFPPPRPFTKSGNPFFLE